MEENLIIARKKRRNWDVFKNLELRYRYNNNTTRPDEILFNRFIMQACNLQANDVLMFAFNVKENYGYFYKEDVYDKTNYILRTLSYKNGTVISTKELREFFEKVFYSNESRVTYYSVDINPDSKGRFKFTRVHYERVKKYE